MGYNVQRLLSLLGAIPLVLAAQTLVFSNPSNSPTEPSSNYVGSSNFTLPRANRVPGEVFDRIIIILLENTDFATANSTPTFQQLAKEGILVTNYHGVGHPSEPNYVAMAGGDTFGLGSDAFVDAPENVSTIVDLLEERGISWASYQENMPCNGYNGMTPSSPPNEFYQRKHHQLAIWNSVKLRPRRAALLRNMNDFAADINANALPQFVYITPNIDNDAHDTTIEFAAQWLQFFLIPLLKNPNFNDDKTLVVVTFDENETGPLNNNVLTLLLGNAVPQRLRGTVDSTYLTHYSLLTTPQVNWGLDCLGRQDTNKTVANVFSFVAEQVGFRNQVVTNPPLTNGTGTIPGPFNPNGMVTPFEAPNTRAQCANSRGRVFVNNNPPINPNLFANGQCPQVAFSKDPNVQWNPSVDAKIAEEQAKCEASTLSIDSL
ncbi:hypothetical protein Clacol_005376 [Clathrus columnatus]|uniref:Acid phosphatase n=1 Tax=Clathrus columnatus TaxID=1419009 RepID=A0AAV5A9X5_9AGAM|nr:hypothetical protein Clacol_005376 [Clathrus columnatus]